MHDVFIVGDIMYGEKSLDIKRIKNFIPVTINNKRLYIVPESGKVIGQMYNEDNCPEQFEVLGDTRDNVLNYYKKLQRFKGN